MSSDGLFWLGVWLILGVSIAIGAFPVSGCARNYHNQYYSSVQKALDKGCSVLEGANSSLHIDCRGLK